MDSKLPYTRLQGSQTKRRSRSVSRSPDETAAGGRRGPRLCLLLAATLLLCMLSWLPIISHKPKRGDLAFVWPSNQTRSTRLLVRPDQVTTLIQPQVCSQGTDLPYLLVIVCSGVNNTAARNAIRGSWARDEATLKNVRVVFLLGHLQNDTQQENILEESLQHGDIIQEGFLDTYANLTVKSLMLLKWFSQNCDTSSSSSSSSSLSSSKARSVEYVMKTDDDMYINLPKLYELVRANKKPNLLLGSLICNAVPIKDPHNKWFVPHYMFSEKKFPNYLSGTGYLMHRTTVSKLFTAALDIPVFHLEDIYVTGILARKVGIRPADNIGFSFARRKFNSCLFKQTITTHQIKHNEMLAIYTKLQSTQSSSCPVIKAKLLRDYGPVKCKWP